MYSLTIRCNFVLKQEKGQEEEERRKERCGEPPRVGGRISLRLCASKISRGDRKTNGPVCVFLGCCASVEILQQVPHHTLLPFGTPLLKPLDSNIQETNRDTKRRDDMNGSIWMGARDGVMVRSVK
jgi:hypothetical protein